MTAIRSMEVVLTMVLVGTLWAGATAQSNCQNVIISLSPCLDYITGNSSTPSSGCCKQLASVVRSQPECLCEVINDGGSNLGIKINKTLAIELPNACNVQTPPLSRCNATSPTGSPAGNPSSPSGGEFKNVPTGGGSSYGNSTNFSFSLLLFFLLFIASYSSIFTSSSF